MDDIIEIAWPRAFTKRPDFLGKGLLISITTGQNAAVRIIRIGMGDAPFDGRQDQYFVEGQVEFDAREVTTGRCDRATIRDAALPG